MQSALQFMKFETKCKSSTTTNGSSPAHAIEMTGSCIGEKGFVQDAVPLDSTGPLCLLFRFSLLWVSNPWW